MNSGNRSQNTGSVSLGAGGDDINELVMRFHDNYARQPCGQNLICAKQVLEQIKNHLETNLTGFKFLRFEYKGSTFEGVKVRKSPHDDDLEFDMDFVMDGGRYLDAIRDPQKQSFSTLKISSRAPSNFFDNFGNGNISACEVLQKFHGQLQRCLYEDQKFKTRITWHGPAINIDIISKENGSKFFSVDLAPAFYLNNETCFIAKPPKGETWSNLWFRSYSLKEKAKLDSTDRNNECRKMVLRVLKVLRRRSEFGGLSSYHLKNALFHTMGHVGQWPVGKIGERTLDVLRTLQGFLNNGRMNHYFGRYNILYLPQPAMDNIKNRIERILNSPHRQRQIFS